MDTFLSRLDWLAGGRKLTPWLVGLGWSNGDITRVKTGHVPGPAKLEVLVRYEGVNLSWLLAGVGTPYLIEYVPDAEALRDRLRSSGAPDVAPRGLHIIDSAYGQICILYWLEPDPNGTARARCLILLGDFDAAASTETSWKSVGASTFDQALDGLALLLTRGQAGTAALFGDRAPLAHLLPDLRSEPGFAWKPSGIPDPDTERSQLLRDWWFLGNELEFRDLETLLALGQRLTRLR